MVASKRAEIEMLIAGAMLDHLLIGWMGWKRLWMTFKRIYSNHTLQQLVGVHKSSNDGQN
jgi:hypothetical protein